jgi:hypothetical protein
MKPSKPMVLLGAGSNVSMIALKAAIEAQQPAQDDPLAAAS